MNVVSVIRDAWEAALDAIMPPRQRSARTKARSFGDIPLLPASHDLLGVRITTLMDYRAGAVQDLIRALKYDGSRHASALAAEVLADYLREELAEAQSFSTRRILLVPIPLHASRRRERGFNQIELVLKALPAEFRDGSRAALASDALVRVRATPQQTRLSRRERLSNVRGAFEIADAALLRRAHVYLLDDVTTTGATLAAAAVPLKRAGAEVTLLALARA